MFGSGKKDDDAGAGRPRGGRAPRRRFDPELIPYGVGLLVFLLVLVVYLTSVGDADAEGAGAVEKIERAFMRSIDSVENEIVDIGKRLAEGLPDSRELGSMMSGREGEHYESLLSAISDGSERVAGLLAEMDGRLRRIEESFIATHEADHEHLHEHLHEHERRHDALDAAAAGGGGGGGGGALPSAAGVEDGVHFVLTSNGNPYGNWQTRFTYYSFNRVKDRPGSVLKKFTRILHRSVDDELMDEIPTFRADPGTPECEKWCDFPVNDRPAAVRAWLAHDSAGAGPRYRYIMMGEPDYLFIKPITAAHLPPPGEATAFRYGYINPDYPNPSKEGMPPVVDITTRIYNNATLGANADARFAANTDIKKVPGTGPCPVIVDRDSLRTLVPLWEEFTVAIEEDADAKESFGWVREMYGYSFAAGKVGVKHNMLSVTAGNLMSQVRTPRRGARAGAAAEWGADGSDSAPGPERSRPRTRRSSTTRPCCTTRGAPSSTRGPARGRWCGSSTSASGAAASRTTGCRCRRGARPTRRARRRRISSTSRYAIARDGETRSPRTCARRLTRPTRVRPGQSWFQGGPYMTKVDADRHRAARARRPPRRLALTTSRPTRRPAHAGRRRGVAAARAHVRRDDGHLQRRDPGPPGGRVRAGVQVRHLVPDVVRPVRLALRLHRRREVQGREVGGLPLGVNTYHHRRCAEIVRRARGGPCAPAARIDHRLQRTGTR